MTKAALSRINQEFRNAIASNQAGQAHIRTVFSKKVARIRSQFNRRKAWIKKDWEVTNEGKKAREGLIAESMVTIKAEFKTKKDSLLQKSLN